MHSLLDSDLLSDCLARQHLHVSHQDPSPPLPVLDDFTGTSTEAHTPLLKTKTNKGQTPGPLNFGACGLICSPSPCFIPALIAHHAAVYFVQLLGSDCGWAGSLSAAVQLPLTRFGFHRSLSMAERGSRSCQVQTSCSGNGQSLTVQERESGSCLGRLLHTQFLPRRLWGHRLKQFTVSVVSSGRNKRVSVQF